MTQLALFPPTRTPSPLMVRDLPLRERPEYRLEHTGAAALSDAELVQLVGRFKQADSAHRLLVNAESLGRLAQMSVDELIALPEVGPTSAAALLAALELGRRLLAAHDGDRVTIRSPQDAADLLLPQMQHLEQEHLVTLILNTRNQVLKVHTVYIGSVNTAMVRVSELFREAIRRNAPALIVAHNHPSGDPNPSPEDVAVTRQMVAAGKLMDIEVLDHLVVGRNRWASLKERRLGFE